MSKMPKCANMWKNAQNCAKNCVKIPRNKQNWKKIARTASLSKPLYNTNIYNKHNFPSIYDYVDNQLLIRIDYTQYIHYSEDTLGMFIDCQTLCIHKK